jgi:hypothetical protein
VAARGSDVGVITRENSLSRLPKNVHKTGPETHLKRSRVAIRIGSD